MVVGEEPRVASRVMKMMKEKEGKEEKGQSYNIVCAIHGI